MMALRLERFDHPPEPARDGTEDARLAGFEAGYAAGWEDAAARTAEAASSSRLELVQALQDLGFGFHEARAHLLSALRPLLEAMAATVLPLIGRETLARHVAEAILPLAEAAAGAPVLLRCHPADGLLLEEALAEEGTAVRFLADETLSPGRIALSAPGREAEIDLPRAMAEVGSALHDFFAADDPRLPGASTTGDGAEPPPTQTAEVRHG